MLAQPDVKTMEEQLRMVKKEIFKSLPTNRLTSKTDSRAFSKAIPHIANFKVCFYIIYFKNLVLVLSISWRIPNSHLELNF